MCLTTLEHIQKASMIVHESVLTAQTVVDQLSKDGTLKPEEAAVVNKYVNLVNKAC